MIVTRSNILAQEKQILGKKIGLPVKSETFFVENLRDVPEKDYCLINDRRKFLFLTFKISPVLNQAVPINLDVEIKIVEIYLN